MAEIAVLVEALFGDKASADLPRRLRSDSSLKLGLEKLYLILKHGVESTGDGKLGLESWDQSQIQAVYSIAKAIASAANSLSGTVSIFYLPIMYIHISIYIDYFLNTC